MGRAKAEKAKVESAKAKGAVRGVERHFLRLKHPIVTSLNQWQGWDCDYAVASN